MQRLIGSGQVRARCYIDIRQVWLIDNSVIIVHRFGTGQRRGQFWHGTGKQRGQFSYSSA